MGDRDKLTQAEKIDAVYDFLFSPPVPGAATRAERIDKVLNALAAGGLGAQVLLWLAGTLVSLAAAMQIIKGWGQP